MSLVSQPKSEAVQLSKIDQQTVQFLVGQAERAANILNNSADKQALLDEMDNPAERQLFHNALASFLAQYGVTIPPIDESVFIPNDDGTVTYAAPQP